MNKIIENTIEHFFTKLFIPILIWVAVLLIGSPEGNVITLFFHFLLGHATGCFIGAIFLDSFKPKQ